MHIFSCFSSLTFYQFCAQSCAHKSDLRSTNTLSLVSTIPRIKRNGVRLFHSNDTIFVYITFLGSVAMPVVRAIKSLILCLRDCASYPSLGLCAFGCVALSVGFFQCVLPEASSIRNFFFCLARKGCGAEFRRVKTPYEYEEVSVLQDIFLSSFLCSAQCQH